MNDVKRVDFFAYIDDDVAELDYHESSDGSWIKAEDYDKLKSEAIKHLKKAAQLMWESEANMDVDAYFIEEFIKSIE